MSTWYRDSEAASGCDYIYTVKALRTNGAGECSLHVSVRVQ